MASGPSIWTSRTVCWPSLPSRLILRLRMVICLKGLPAIERARWLLGNSQMLVSMVFDPNGKPRGMQKMIDRGIAHLLGA